ncbi:dipeptidase [Roseomonas aerophila]|uniref:Dipeptidase n=1 Tax=Teichococcus aerophilus TaxID=1224513 RepID=A0ABR7RMJ7_9PROT|nr:membrane dipeptidase [Pseudoroseomonas aerophila]MBC9207506.1 dipeptidase [Pseudoroseomonas aerophila]
MLIDALQCGHFSREVFSQLRQGGVSAVTVTCGFWEDPMESFDSLGKWRDLVGENADLVALARTPAEIEAVAASGRTAIVLGFQNTDLFGNRIRLVEMFAELGVRVVQLTYNNQNSVGGSCYEAEDSGLARFGRELVREMNSAGILIDCSHVGERTTLDTIRHSQKPIAVTHGNARSVFDHSRNKSDDILHALRESKGVIGCAVYRNITGDYFCASARNWAEMVAKTVEIAGIDSVGIGTDYGHDNGPADYAWMRMGRWTRHVDYGASAPGKPLKTPRAEWLAEGVSGLGKIAGGLKEVGFHDDEIAKLTHGNWMRLYGETFRQG